MRKPNLFIVGHPRSGTSSLHSYLKQHPDVFMTAIKEPNFFARDFRIDSDNFHKKKLYFPYRTESQYLRLYINWTDEKIAGEATATNLCSQVSAREISRFNPESKVIMMLREPVEFLHSFHSAARFALGEHIDDFQTAIFAEKDRRNGKVLSKRVIAPSWLYYSNFIKYSEQIQRFQSHFDSAQIKVIIFDDFKKNTAGVYQEILEFLSVDPNFTPDFHIVNPNKQIRWPTVKKYTLDSPYFRKMLRFVFSTDTYSDLKNFYKNKIVKHEPRQPLNEAFKLRLMQEFKPEVEKLGDLLKRDLISLWGYVKV